MKVNIDTGVYCNIMDEFDFQKLRRAVSLTPTTSKVYPYNSHVPLDLKGAFYACVRSDFAHTQMKFYVFRGARRSGAVIGLPGAQKLGLVRFVDKFGVQNDPLLLGDWGRVARRKQHSDKKGPESKNILESIEECSM